MPKRANIPSVKSDSERGEWGSWAYGTRRRFGLSLERVAADVGYSDGAVRKTEAGSPGYRPPSRAVRAALADYYARLAAERGIVIDPAPGESSVAPVESPDLAAAILALAEAVKAQTDAMVAQQDRHEEWVRELIRDLAESRARLGSGASSDVPVRVER